MTLSLESFLSTHQLDTYYTSFLNAGATDHDLSHLVQLNDQELSEFLLAVNMLPFHAIKLKKALREYRSSYRSPTLTTIHSDDPVSTVVPTVDDNDNSKRSTIVSHAIIYGKKSTRPLTSYEVAINQASIQLALADSSLLINKGHLFDLAKKKLLEEGYQYKRGKSRSKLMNNNNNNTTTTTMTTSGVSICPRPSPWLSEVPSTPSPPSSPPQSTPSTDLKRIKRKEHALKQSHQRQLHIKHLETRLDQVRQSIINQTSTTAANGATTVTTITDYPSQSSSPSLQDTKADLVKKIAKLKAQERKHQWYKRKTHQQNQEQPLRSLEPIEPLCMDSSRPRLLPLPSPPQHFSFFPSLPSPPVAVFSPPQSEVRAKVLTVRDCCNA